MKAVFVTADNIQSEPMDVPADFVKHNRSIYRVIGPVLSFAAYDAMRDEMGSFARRLYSIDCLEYILIQGHRETVAVYREVR